MSQKRILACLLVATAAMVAVCPAEAAWVARGGGRGAVGTRWGGAAYGPHGAVAWRTPGYRSYGGRGYWGSGRWYGGAAAGFAAGTAVGVAASQPTAVYADAPVAYAVAPVACVWRTQRVWINGYAVWRRVQVCS